LGLSSLDSRWNGGYVESVVDIAGDIVSPPKAGKLRRKLDSLKGKGSFKSSDIEAFARAVGRQQSKRGKEPTWINPSFPSIPPVSIPNHSAGLNKFTAKAILGQLEKDIEALEKKAETEEPGV